MKKRYLLIFLIILMIIPSVIKYQEKLQLKQDTTEYLEEKGYTEEDFEEVYVVNTGEDETIFSVVITFKDEPHRDYFYSYKPNSKEIHQIDLVDKEKDNK